MSIDLGATQHPLLAALEAIGTEIDQVADVDPIYMRTKDKGAALALCSRLEARLAAMKGRVMAAGDDIAIETGARSTAAWLAIETRDSHGATRRAAKLAAAVEERHHRVGAAMAQGDVNSAQAHVITEALDALPSDLDPELRAKAEDHLVAKPEEFGPRELRRLGERILEAIAPEIADQAEYKRLLAAERRARKATRLSFKRRGDGSTDIHIRLSDAVANRLRVYLDGFTSPRGTRLTEVDGLPLSHRRALPFVALLENIPASGLPRQGGTATTVLVKIEHEKLLRDLEAAGIAETSPGDRITADEARRLACQGGIIPFVMGGKSVVLDQGRKKRLHDENQRAAVHLIHSDCAEVDCTIPVAWTEIHHPIPWSEGGTTNHRDAIPLCCLHHRRIHDRGWVVRYHAGGGVSFTRRQ